MLSPKLTELLLCPVKSVLFYPSCGNTSIFPEVFQLDYDLFVFSDYGRADNLAGSLRDLPYGRRASEEFIGLYLRYEPPKPKERKQFWESFSSKLEEIDDNSYEQQEVRVIHQDSDCVVFCFKKKMGLLLFWDNNIALAWLKEHHIKIGCLVGVNDGCQGGGNYECVNNPLWLERAMKLAPEPGMIHITDHRCINRCVNGTKDWSIDNPSLINYNENPIDQKTWLRETGLVEFPFPSDDMHEIECNKLVPIEVIRERNRKRANLQAISKHRLDYRSMFDLSRERDPKEILHDILLARGFLVEFDDKGDLRLSDNAMLRNPGQFQDMWITYMNDKKYLKNVLWNCGCADLKNDIITINGYFAIDRLLEAIFSFKQISRESVFPRYFEKPDRFFNHQPNRIRGFKIPVYILEPYIALLVKAYSAIGVQTCSSCDGHGDEYAKIIILSYTFSRWAEKVTKIAIGDVNPNSEWIFDEYNLKIKSKNNKYTEKYYKGILDVANFIYRNRVQLSEIKRQITTRAVRREYDNPQTGRQYVYDLIDEGLSKFIAVLPGH